jgi:hypothetical protein
MTSIIECKRGMTFEECELTILRSAVDNAEKLYSKQIIANPEINKIIEIVEKFLKTEQLICYGGTAINNILPTKDQFYDKELELPDYDFYSKTPIDDAKRLADIYFSKGFIDVEAKAGVHHGTYKVFVNFMPVADITYLSEPLYNAIKKDSVKINGILYAPPDFLRMSMYLELSRPRGDVSRWEKVLKRLILLNKHSPLPKPNCKKIKIQRMLSTNNIDAKEVFNIVRMEVVKNEGVFFGGYANILYSRYLPSKKKPKIKQIPDFDVLSEDPLNLSRQIQKKLEAKGMNNVRLYKHEGIGEIIAPHYELAIEKETVIFIYEPLACHSYNILNEDGHDIRIATIDTMLSFYLAFVYADRTYYDKNRILCMATYLFEVQQHNRLKQESILKRFSMNCYGKQQTINNFREEKAVKYIQLKNKRGTPEYDEWFLKYNPGHVVKVNKSKRVKLPTALKVLKSNKKLTVKKSRRKNRSYKPRNNAKTKRK